MLKGAYSEKFKTIQQERLNQLKEQHKEFVKAKSDRAKELSKETNRRRKALEERKKEQQENEEKAKEEALAKRKQEQQEATQRFQKDTLQKKKPTQQAANGSDKEPFSVRDGRYIVRGQVVEVKDGKQVERATPQDTQLILQQEGREPETWRNEMTPKDDLQTRHDEYSNCLTNGGILYAMNSLGNEGKLYSSHPGFNPYGPPWNQVGHESDGKMGEITDDVLPSDTLTVAEQERLRADAITNGGPKLAFINSESQKEPPEGALPCIMGRDSPGGSVTSLDSLDEVPSKVQERGTISRSGIIAKNGKDATKSAGKRRVTFSDSIEFDDGVTGQLVTEEKQSTKVYTMLYARNNNNYYNIPSMSSTAASSKSVASQKGNKHAGATSVAQAVMEQNNTSSGFNVVKAADKETSVVTVVHTDQPKPKRVALASYRPTNHETTQYSARQGNLSKEMPLGQETYGKDSDKAKDNANFVSDQALTDSLEIMRDSLDEKDSSSVTQPGDEECKNKSAVTWTIGSSSLRDSLERYVKSAAESTAEELTDEALLSDGQVKQRNTDFASDPSENSNSCFSFHEGDGERERGFALGFREETVKDFVSKPQEERGSDYLNAEHEVRPSPVISGYQHYQPVNASANPGMVVSPYANHDNSNTYHGVHSHGTFQQNFPYPFYTSAGLMGMNPVRQEHVSLESTPIPYASHLAATEFHVEGREVVQSIDSQRSPVEASLSSKGHAVNRVNNETVGATGVKGAGTLAFEAKNETSRSVISRQKNSSSPSSTTSTASSGTRSPRSFIPRPPATKKSGRGRVYPGGHYRKQITARPRKAINSHPMTAGSAQSVKYNKMDTNNNGKDQTEGAVRRQNSPSPRSGKGKSGRIHGKRLNSSKSESPDDDGIIEGIKRNMEMMNMRARTTAAEEQHRRILDSLRLDFSDNKQDKSSLQASPVYARSCKEQNGVAESIVVKHDGTTRRVHHPRVGSAGSRSGKPPVGGSARMVSHEISFQPTGSQGGRPAGSSMRMDVTNNEHNQPVRLQSSKPSSGLNTRLDSASAVNHHSGSSSEGGPPVGNGARMEFANDNYHLGLEGYGKPVGTGAGTVPTGPEDWVKGMMQSPSPIISQRRMYQERRDDYPTSSIAHPTSAAITRQEREETTQAKGISLYEREDNDFKQLNRSVSLEKTPTDDEINHLWAHVRSYLHGGNSKSVGSDSCVNKVDVRRSRTRSSSTQREFVQRTVQQQNMRESRLMNTNGHQFLGAPPQGGGSTIGGLRRYGSHEVLRRNSSSESLSLKRPPLLQHRASRNRRLQGPDGRPPLPRQNECKPSPSQAGPSTSVSTRVGGPQPLSQAEMQAVMMASEKEMLNRRQHEKLSEMTPYQQFEGVMSGRTGPSALSLEEQRLLQSLDRLNERLKAQEEITKAISQKPRMNDVGFRKAKQGGLISSGSRQTQNSPYASNRSLLHTR